jgi:protein phosphatase
MFCKNCRQDVGEVDFCPVCGYEFTGNQDNSEVTAEPITESETGVPFHWVEQIRQKPVKTGLGSLDDRLLLAKEDVEGFTGKYNKVRQFAGAWLPEEFPQEEEKPFRLFLWDGTWPKLDEWLNQNPAPEQRIRIWSHIASFVHHCHENGLIVNQFHPHSIWINPDKIQPVFEAIEFISVAGNQEVIIFNEGFSSPEVREGNWEGVGFAADIYCLGKLFQWMLGPGIPENHEDGFGSGMDTLAGLKSLPRHLGFGIGKCLHPDNSKRWSSVAQLFEYLRESELEPVSMTGFTHVGRRELNEDAVYYSNRRMRCLEVSYDTAIAVLADGMGGLERGEVAANTVIQMSSARLEREIDQILNEPGNIRRDPAPDLIFDLIRNVITGCNRSLVKQRNGNESPMGSTVVVAVIINHYLYMGYVGDSRLYIFDEAGRIQYVSEDHSLIGKREAIGDIIEAEALIHPNKNILYQAMGLKETIRVDTYGTKLKPGYKIILCSDGICGCFLRHDFIKLLEAYPDIIELGNALFFEALERNSTDNCSVILAEIVKGSYLHEYQFELIAAPGECGVGNGAIHELLPDRDRESGTSGSEPCGY